MLVDFVGFTETAPAERDRILIAWLINHAHLHRLGGGKTRQIPDRGESSAPNPRPFWQELNPDQPAMKTAALAPLLISSSRNSFASPGGDMAAIRPTGS